RVVHAPAVRVVPLDDDSRLYEVTRACLSTPFDIVVITSEVGLGGWLEAADGWGLGEDLRGALAGARTYARGPKASGAVHAAGMQDVASPPCESTWDILERLLAEDLASVRVMVQMHGASLDDFTRVLGTAGAEVVEVHTYRTLPPEDEGLLERLVAQVLAREVHAVTFTSGAAASHLLVAASRIGALEGLLGAFREVVPVCVGAVAAAPLERLGVPTVQPGQARIGAMVHALTSALKSKAVAVRAAGHDIEVRGAGAVVDGVFRPLPPVPMAALRALVREPGRVLSRAELHRELPGDGGDEHGAEMAVSRLRMGLGDPRCVRNVVKRGYQLACERRPPRLTEPLLPHLTPLPTEVPLHHSVGGVPGLREAVERLYSRLLADPQVSHYFRGVDMPRLKRHQVLLLSQLLGGPAQYDGRELAEAHAGLRVTVDDYACVVRHLVAVLQELGIDAKVIVVIIRTLGDLAPDIVEGSAATSSPRS
ncbi:MAG: uroporphyrinogen-III synthase, partial [Actinomycetota bacterium]|nr:uroporphyrinogen-III synthase [Actinomycetota bacterium]